MARSISPRGRLLCARNQHFCPKFCRIATAFVHLCIFSRSVAPPDDFRVSKFSHGTTVNRSGFGYATSQKPIRRDAKRHGERDQRTGVEF